MVGGSDETSLEAYKWFVHCSFQNTVFGVVVGNFGEIGGFNAAMWYFLADREETVKEFFYWHWPVKHPLGFLGEHTLHVLGVV